MKMKALNLGCGRRFHSDWVNVNFTSTGPSVIAADLSRGIPFAEQSFDVVYHSHLLEHFPKSEAPELISECYRTLKPGGVVRVVVPDLENIARQYLQCLEAARRGDTGADENYDWMMLELLDQLVRHHSGGAMAEYFFQQHLPNEQFILSRCGMEAQRLIEIGIKKRSSSGDPPEGPGFRYGWKSRLLKLLLGENRYKAMEIGRFRMTGQNHLWMYDSYSLARLLRDTGFANVVECDADQSAIDGWPGFNLDTNPDGSVYKPDSLYMEARKP